MNEVIESCDCGGPGYQKIKIAHSFFTAAETSGGLYTFDAGERRELPGKFIGSAAGKAQQEAARRLAVVFDRTQNLFFELGSHSRQGSEFLFTTDSFKVVEALDIVMFVKQCNAFWAESLNFQQLQSGSRIAGQHFIAAIERSTLADFGQDCRQAFPDTGDFSYGALGVADDVLNPFSVAGDNTGGIAIAADAKSIRAGHLHEIRRLLQKTGDFFVFHCGFRQRRVCVRAGCGLGRTRIKAKWVRPTLPQQHLLNDTHQLTTAAGAAAVLALITRAIASHDAAALRTKRRVTHHVSLKRKRLLRFTFRWPHSSL